MRRHEISDEQWVKIKDSPPGKTGVPGRAAEDNRLFIEAVCWIARTGLHGATFSNDSENGTLSSSGSIGGANGAPGDAFWRSGKTRISNTSCSTRRPFAPTSMPRGRSKKRVDEALGRSRGGFSTKLHLAVDAEGRPLELTAIPGQEHDIC